MRHFSTLLVMFAIGASTATSSNAQTLKPAEQTKVRTLKSRLNKAVEGHNRAISVLNSYNLFFVTGKIQAGDNNAASIYGTAVKNSNFGGLGALHDKSFFIVLNPADDDLVAGGSYFQGLCTFAGAPRGANTYISAKSQPRYIQALNEDAKWKAIITSIEAEISAVYLPYQQKAKNQAAAENAKQTRLAQLRKERDEASAAIEAQNQARVDQARQKLAQEQQATDTAKQERFTKESADAEIARLEAEAVKVKAEKARLDAAARKQAEEEALQKAKELEELEAKNQAAIEVLKNTPSLIPGVQLGKVRLGMSEAQVLQLMGSPKVSLQLRKVDTTSNNDRVEYYASFVPRKIRRDRYFLDATGGLDITYEGSAAELQYLSQERGIEEVKAGDLKTSFVFDVLYLNDKVVQIETDSPQFFTADQRNVQTPLKSLFLSEKPFDSHFILDYRDRRSKSTSWGHDTNTTEFGSDYIINREKGFSVCLEALSQGAYSTDEPTPPSPFPSSRLKFIVHAPNTFPYTGDYQLGISIFNKQAGRSDAENIEERMYPTKLNPTAAQSAIANAVEPEKEGLKAKVKRGIGGVFRPR